MSDIDEHAIDDTAALREHYREPHPVVLKKQVPTVDDAAATFVAASPFFVLATTSDRGTDASPRGGPPGFVAVLDERRIAFADLAGNNRLDSYTNIVAHDEVGLLFLVPGLGETLRVNGRASLTTDPAILEATAFDGTTPKVAIVVDVTECFIHCAKAFRRSGMWDPETWHPEDARPSPGQILAEHLELDVDPALIEADLEAGYAATMWIGGGGRSEDPGD